MNLFVQRIGRFIVLTAVVFVVIGAVLRILHHQPKVILTYVVHGPGHLPSASSDECAEHDGWEELDLMSDQGRRVRAQFCFKAYRSGENNMMLVPYGRDADGRVVSKQNNAREVRAYMRAEVDRFRLTPEEAEAADIRWWEMRLQDGLVVTAVTMSILALIWLLSCLGAALLRLLFRASPGPAS